MIRFPASSHIASEPIVLPQLVLLLKQHSLNWEKIILPETLVPLQWTARSSDKPVSKNREKFGNLLLIQVLNFWKANLFENFREILRTTIKFYAFRRQKI